MARQEDMLANWRRHTWQFGEKMSYQAGLVLIDACEAHDVTPALFDGSTKLRDVANTLVATIVELESRLEKLPEDAEAPPETEISATELRLVALHNHCVAQDLIPTGFGKEWELGMHLLQMCLEISRRRNQD